MKKSFWIPLIASFGTMIVLYMIGFIADIDLLRLRISLTEGEIAFLPIVAGMVAGFICERIVKSKS